MQVYVTVASRWLLPRLHRFEAANPELRLRLSTSHRGWDFDADNADVGMIYREPPLEPDLTYLPLFRSRLIAVADHGLVQGGVGLRQPAELINHRLLSVYTAQRDWPLLARRRRCGRACAAIAACCSTAICWRWRPPSTAGAWPWCPTSSPLQICAPGG